LIDYLLTQTCYKATQIAATEDK